MSLQVVAAACQATCCLHRIDPSVGLPISQLAARYLEKVQQCSAEDFPEDSCRFSRRYLFVLGHILQHGAELVEEKSSSVGFQVGSRVKSALMLHGVMFCWGDTV